MLSGHLNATRFPQKPLHQPAYSFAHVPKAKSDLKGSCLQLVTEREHIQQSMGEMLLLCKEAVRRRKTKITGSKPLSLEYLADRLDVDDPFFSFLVRTEDNLANQESWKKGMLQGFVTVTTFTNWQKNFRWDSLNEGAFEADSDAVEEEMLRGERKWDSDGALAGELQETVHMGSIWQEGIVWPRVAEISLLGGLGCGRALLSLVIERLECMKSSAKSNYDYVVLQATDNSVSFYESMGFIRVGAVIKLESRSENSSRSSSDDDDDAIVAEAVEEGSPEKPTAFALPNGVTSSDLFTYETEKKGESPSSIAKDLMVDAWDIVFLNKGMYPELSPGSKLMAGTMLHVPKKVQGQTTLFPERAPEVETPKWYVAKENDTPRTISRMFKVNCFQLVEANKAKLPGLLSNSRLKRGTKIKVSHLDVREESFKPYSHWSFPDDEYEEGEPSYMMARKLNRRRGNSAKIRPVQDSLSAKISDYAPTSLLIPPSPGATMPSSDLTEPFETTPSHGNVPTKRKHKRMPGELTPPKRPPSAYILYVAEERKHRITEFAGRPIGEVSGLLSQMWKTLNPELKASFEKKAAYLMKLYREEKELYNAKAAAAAEFIPPAESDEDSKPPTASLSEQEDRYNLFNKVVVLKPGTVTEISTSYKYWYVLTYIPDLKWCHLAPMRQVGVFDQNRAKGRPRWMLVNESLGHELDIGASSCAPLRSRSMRRCPDADKEEWDIIDDGSDPFSRTVEKAKLVRYRKSSSSSLLSGANEQALYAVLPDHKAPVKVVFKGEGISCCHASARKRGRPKGSKNKKKKIRKSPKFRPAGVPSAEITYKVKDAPSEPLKEDSRSVVRSTNATQIPQTQTERKSLTSDHLKRNTEKAKHVSGGLTEFALIQHSDPTSTRPRRSAAPSWLGESPGSTREKAPGLKNDTPALHQSLPKPSTPMSTQGSGSQRSDPKKKDAMEPHRISATSESSTARPRRSAAPSWLGESPGTPRQNKKRKSTGGANTTVSHAKSVRLFRESPATNRQSSTQCSIDSWIRKSTKLA